MKKAALIGLTFLLYAPFAFAAEAPKVDPVLCATSKIHTENPDVTYKPGVDVHGKPVTPADLPNPSDMMFPEHMIIPLTLDLAKTLNLDTSAPPFNKLGSGTEVQLGKLEIHGTAIYYNDKPISDDAWNRLASACAEAK